MRIVEFKDKLHMRHNLQFIQKTSFMLLEKMKVEKNKEVEKEKKQKKIKGKHLNF